MAQQAAIDKMMGITNLMGNSGSGTLAGLSNYNGNFTDPAQAAQFLSQYDPTIYQGGSGALGGSIGTPEAQYQNLINGYNSDTSKLAAAQAAAQSLYNKYGVGNQIGLIGSGQQNETGYDYLGGGGNPNGMTTAGLFNPTTQNQAGIGKSTVRT